MISALNPLMHSKFGNGGGMMPHAAAPSWFLRHIGNAAPQKERCTLKQFIGNYNGSEERCKKLTSSPSSSFSLF